MLKNKAIFKPLNSNFSNKTDIKLEKAKNYPIENLYLGNLKGNEKRKMGCCPFHEEANPSFAIYPQTNTWNCFAGCGGGDVISFYMKAHNCDFQTALEALAEL